MKPSGILGNFTELHKHVSSKKTLLMISSTVKLICWSITKNFRFAKEQSMKSTESVECGSLMAAFEHGQASQFQASIPSKISC